MNLHKGWQQRIEGARAAEEAPLPLPHPGQRPKYRDPRLDRLTMKLLPGEFYATREDEAIVTILGSCVAACLRDPVAGVGGMNHFLLPATSRQQDDPRVAARYGVGAMEYLINELMHLGARRSRLEAKVFGGARVVQGLSDIGERNNAFIRSFLEQERIPLLAEDLGGPFPRKIYFLPAKGEVYVHLIRKVRNDTLFVRESRLFEAVSRAPASSDIELFS